MREFMAGGLPHPGSPIASEYQSRIGAAPQVDVRTNASISSRTADLTPTITTTAATSEPVSPPPDRGDVYIPGPIVQNFSAPMDAVPVAAVPTDAITVPSPIPTEAKTPKEKKKSDVPLPDEIQVGLVSAEEAERVSALTKWYELDFRSSVGVATAITHDRALGEDAAQTVWGNLFSKAQEGTLRNEGLRALLYRSTINSAITEIRRLKRIDRESPLAEGYEDDMRSPLEARIVHGTREGISKNPEDVVVEHDENVAALREAFEKAGPDFAEAVYLAREGFSYDEIANMLGVKRGTVSSKISRGTKRMTATEPEAEHQDEITDRHRNELTALFERHAGEPMSTARVASELGVSKQVVEPLLGELMEREDVVRERHDPRRTYLLAESQPSVASEPIPDPDGRRHWREALYDRDRAQIKQILQDFPGADQALIMAMFDEDREMTEQRLRRVLRRMTVEGDITHADQLATVTYTKPKERPTTEQRVSQAAGLVAHGEVDIVDMARALRQDPVVTQGQIDALVKKGLQEAKPKTAEELSGRLSGVVNLVRAGRVKIEDIARSLKVDVPTAENYLKIAEERAQRETH